MRAWPNCPTFPALRELMPMDVPDEGYRHIARCEGLESLILMYCRETGDAATEHLVRLPRLKYYFASYTRITDRSPELLSHRDSLERITFDGCASVTNAGLTHLARLPRFESYACPGPGSPRRSRAISRRRFAFTIRSDG